MGRRTPAVLLAVGFAALLAWYTITTQRVIAELRREATRSGLMSARVFRALSDTSEGASTAALVELASHIRESGVPVVVEDPHGTPSDTANLPFAAPFESPQMRAYMATLDRQNLPVVEPGVGIGALWQYAARPRGLRVIPVLQGALLAFLIVFGVITLRTRAHVEREKVWAGMARESAHQLGTPLSSLSGWLELLRDGMPERGRRDPHRTCRMTSTDWNGWPTASSASVGHRTRNESMQGTSSIGWPAISVHASRPSPIAVSLIDPSREKVI